MSLTLGVSAACRVLGLPRSQLYARAQPVPPLRRTDAAHSPLSSRRGLSPDERVAVLTTLNSVRFQDSAPREVYGTLLTEGLYLCHWRTMYRVLGEQDQVREQRDQLRHPTYHKPQLLAQAPRRVWTWDITRLLSGSKWAYFYLYVLLDIFSRFVVGWMVAEIDAASRGELDRCSLTWREEPSVCVVAAAHGYPGKVRTGDVITGIAEAEAAGATVFHAGTRQCSDGTETSGGRVLGVTASSANLPEAIDHAHDRLGDGHDSAGVAGGNEALGLAVTDQPGGHPHAGVALGAQRLGGVVVHGDDVAGMDNADGELAPAVVFGELRLEDVLLTHEQDVDILLLCGPDRT